MIRTEIVVGNHTFYAHRESTNWQVDVDPVEAHQRMDDETFAKHFVKMIPDASRFAVYMEDMVLVCPEKFTLVALDTFTGATHRDTLSIDGMQAVLALAIGGDDIEGSSALYAIAEKAIARWPNECRPIP